MNQMNTNVEHPTLNFQLRTILSPSQLIGLRCSMFETLNSLSSEFTGLGVRCSMFAIFAAAVAVAAPLDDQIAAFKKADTRQESSVAQILALGLKEHRAAEEQIIEAVVDVAEDPAKDAQIERENRQ